MGERQVVEEQPASPVAGGLDPEAISWITSELDPHDLAGNLSPDFVWRDLVYKELIKQGATAGEANDFRWCGSNYRAVKVCDADITHSKPVPISCHRRYCPQCARRASAKLVKVHTPQVLEIVKANTNHNYRLRSVVLTTKIDLYAPDVKEQVKLAVALVNKFFDLVGGSKLPDKYRNRWSEPSHEYFTGEGLIFSIEFGPEGNLLHFHCLWFGRYIEKFWMSDTWFKLSGFPVTWIESVLNTAESIQEALKYVSKMIKTKVDPVTGEVIERLPPPKYIAALAHVLRGSRRVFGRGCFRGIKADVDDEEEAAGCTCGICGGKAELVNMSSWKIRFYRDYLPAMKQLDLRLGNNSADPPETAQPPPKLEFGKLVSQQKLEDESAIRRSKDKYGKNWF